MSPVDRISVGLLIALALLCLGHLVGSWFEEAAERKIGPMKGPRE